MASIGDKIRMYRTRKGMSQLDLAAEAGLQTSTISRAESGELKFIPGSLFRIIAALGVSLADVLTDGPNVTAVKLGVQLVPLLDRVQAGAWSEVNHALGDEEMREFVPVDLDHSPDAFAMRICGDSMEPDFREGDVVVLDPSVPPQPGDFVVATDSGGEATFKQYKSRGLNAAGQDVFELLPLNPLYAPIRSDRTQIRIVGTMVEHKRYRRR